MTLSRRWGLWLATAAAAAAVVAGTAVSEDRKEGNEAREVFPHQLHVEEMEITCETCHVASDRPEEETQAPSPAACQECHESGDIAGYFPAGSFHGPGFLHTHQLRTRAAGDRCSICHEGSETCVTCHEGENLDLLSHPRNYLFLHPEEARQAQVDCSSCHRLAGFCTDCHAAEGIRPGSHDVPSWTRGYIHGAEARRDPEYCAACHDQGRPVCLDCHQEP